MQRRRAAFTLIELLTVMAILALLIGILVPSLTGARRAAKANVCLSHLKGIGGCLAIYLNENDDRLPPFQLEFPSPGATDRYVNDDGCMAPRWQWFLRTEMGPVVDPLPFKRNTHGREFVFWDEVNAKTALEMRTMSHDLFTCPELVEDGISHNIRDGAYGYNYQYLGNTRTDTDSRFWDNFAVGLHQIRKPAATISIADSRGSGRNRHGRHSFTLDPPRLGTEVRATRFGPSDLAFDGGQLSGDLPPGLDAKTFAYSPVETRHKNIGNVLFLDTHAEAMTLAALGYEQADGATPSVPKGTAIPSWDPTADKSDANNRLWNGDGTDDLAYRPAGVP